MHSHAEHGNEIININDRTSADELTNKKLNMHSHAEHGNEINVTNNRRRAIANSKNYQPALLFLLCKALK